METPPSIHLHIDRVILDGLTFTTADAGPIRIALETKLARVLGEALLDTPTTSVALEGLPAAQFVLEPASTPAGIGRELAVTLGTSLSDAFAAVPPATAQ